ncbi:Protein of unknown function [Allokutzneria albata]|uniref:DUF998 domain-containing protein n=2 Tax=Allokutzneria albata TaxID=211114 RepID=A0A1H0DJL7_ALLAB|nr:Protein of unknown function [Allokutzneria albata]
MSPGCARVMIAAMDLNIAGAPAATRAPRLGITVAWMGVGISGALMAVLHGQSFPSPYSQTISTYGVGPLSQVYMWALVALGVGSLAFLAGMVRWEAPYSPLAWTCVGIWSGGLLLAGVLPMDTTSTERTPFGMLHNLAAVAAFLGLPTAGMVLGKRYRAHPQYSGYARASRRLGIFGFVMLFAFGVSFFGMMEPALIDWFPGPNPVGITERLLVVGEVVLLAVLMRWSAEITRTIRTT